MILIHIASGSLSCVLVVLPSLLGCFCNYSSYFLGVIWRELLGGEHFWCDCRISLSLRREKGGFRAFYISIHEKREPEARCQSLQNGREAWGGLNRSFIPGLIEEKQCPVCPHWAPSPREPSGCIANRQPKEIAVSTFSDRASLFLYLELNFIFIVT